jgi:hypothetical protein
LCISYIFIAMVVRIMVKVPTLSMSSDPNAASGTRSSHSPPPPGVGAALVGEGSTHLPFLILVDLGRVWCVLCCRVRIHLRGQAEPHAEAHRQGTSQHHET